MGPVDVLPRRYASMVRRYAEDVYRFMSEIARVLKLTGKAILIVGNSCLKGLFIRNSDEGDKGSRDDGASIIASD